MGNESAICPDCAMRRRGFLSRMPPEILVAIRCQMRRQTLAPGTVLAARGQVPRGVHAVQEGLVKLQAPGPRGQTRITDLVGPGDLVGVCSAFGRKSQSDAVALTEVVACFTPGPAFVALLRSNAAIASALSDHLLTVIEREADRLRGMGTNTAVERVASFLVDGRLPRAVADRVDLPLSRRELAGLLGITPETLARSLRHLSDRGLVDVEDREIRIRDADALIALADS